MKFTLPKDVLLKTTQVVQNAINQKTTLPILANVLIDAFENELIFSATDLDIGVITTLPIKPTMVGSITIPARKFIDIIKELPAADVTISVKKNNLVHIECQNSVFKIMGLPKDEFPQLPEFKNKDTITAPQKTVKTMVSMTAFAMSHDETRYILNGILMTLQPTVMRLVATDGRRLAVAEAPMQLPKIAAKKVVIPIKAVAELERTLGDTGDVKIVFGDNQLACTVDGITIISRLIEGEFPHYEQVIPKEVKEKVVVKRELFLAALKRAALFTTPDSMAVRLDVTRDKMVLSKNAQYLGEAREELTIDYKGKDLAVGFNPAYLIDVLKNLTDEMIAMEIADAEKPGVIRIGERYTYVVLPMQLA